MKQKRKSYIVIDIMLSVKLIEVVSTAAVGRQFWEFIINSIGPLVTKVNNIPSTE